MTRYTAAISTDDGEPSITLAIWMRIADSDSYLMRPEPRIGRNPATGQQIVLQPPASTFHLLSGDGYAASFGWDADNNTIRVTFDSPVERFVLQHAQRIANQLNAKFAIIDTWDDEM